jgi:hypothetical protein
VSRLRTHVVSVLAVMMALAVGVALGAGPLQREVSTSPAASGPEDRGMPEPESRVDVLERSAASSDAFALRLSRSLVKGTLAGRAVTVVDLPGAPRPVVRGLLDMVAQAEGRVVSRVSLDEQLLDVANRQLVGELGSQMASAARTRVRVPDDAGDYERMGRLLARAFVTSEPGGDEADVAGRSIIAGLETAGLVEAGSGAGRRGALVLVVAGPPYGSQDQRDGAGTIAATLLAELARAADALLLAGPVSAGAPDGVVAQVRTDPLSRRTVSTVDTADLAAGAVAAVLALAADARGRSGHYGSESAPGGPLPPRR